MALERSEAQEPGVDEAALRQRRAKFDAARETPDHPPIGLALSGGGIRSATFCFGVLRALAKNRVLHRFDYLSTVSGGGYIGAAFGRLFRDGVDPLEVERGLAKDDSLLLWWLRNNGRYLLPSGSADIVRAFSGQARSFVATQFAVMMAAFFLSCVVVLPHFGYAIVLGPSSLPDVHVSLWWWPLLPVAVASATLSYGYWMLGLNAFQRVGTSLISLIVGGYLLYFGLHPAPDSGTLAAGLSLGLALITLPAVLGCVCATVSNWRHAQEVSRVAYTKWLAWCLTSAGVLVLLGCMDMASWFLRDAMLTVLHRTHLFTFSWSVGWVSLLVILARAVAPVLSSKERVASTGLPLEMIGNILGVLLITLVALFWMGVFQLVLLPTDNRVLLDQPAAFLYYPAVLLVGTLVLLLTGHQLQELNRSSLHFFYRSRLARAYVSVGNYRTQGSASSGCRFPVSTLEQAGRTVTGQTERVTDLLPCDDELLATYEPHIHGGPVHLINCCINQTVDDRTGMFNADRKGVALTVGPLGVETGTQLPSGVKAPKNATLSEWVAISGAAVGSGMGSLTRPGVAVLTFLSGFRLGYWHRNLIKRSEKRLPLAKYRSMLREMFAQFPGLGAPYWYVSDGGHFDNTGVYALLKRELSTIVLADCGADPDYRFGDIENLVRKARIDYAATIEFVDPVGLKDLAGPLAPCFGTPASIVSEPDCACLLLARVSYGSGKRGALLVIKPRVTPGLALDLAGYAGRNPLFPQQSTINQFFSEEEWEAYCALGLALAKHIDAGLLRSLPGWAWQAPVVSDAALAQAQPEPTVTRAPRRLAAAVGTSLGAGALITALVAGWQAWDDSMARKSRAAATFNGLVGDAMDDTQAEGAALDNSLKHKLRMLQSYIDTHHLSEDQQQVVREVADSVRKLCSKQPETQQLDCEDTAAKLGTDGNHVGSFWTGSLARYSNWPARPVLGEASASQPAAAPPPARPPSGAAETAASLATTTAPAAGSTAFPSQALMAGASPPAAGRSPGPPPSETRALQGAHMRRDEKRTSKMCTPLDGRPYTLYTQVYEERQRPRALRMLSSIRPLGLDITEVENVTATAERNQRKPPIPWGRPTLLYPPGGQACAKALAVSLGWYMGPVKIQPLPASLSAGSGNLELWIPNSTTISHASVIH